jgi:hypothetical protein
MIDQVDQVRFNLITPSKNDQVEFACFVRFCVLLAQFSAFFFQISFVI